MVYPFPEEQEQCAEQSLRPKATAGDPCRAEVVLNGRCLSHLGSDELDTYLATLGPGADIRAEGVVFTVGLLNPLLTAMRHQTGPIEVGYVQLTNVLFTENANFVAVIFKKGADFRGTTFKEGADFGGATFTKNANFQDATFTQQADFWEATFTQDARFRKATFTQDATFRFADFNSNAVFTQDADFRGATTSRGFIRVASRSLRKSPRRHQVPETGCTGLKKAGHWPISWMEFHRARMPTKDEAKLLEIPLSLPVLEIVRVGTSGGDNKPIEVTEYIVASDRVETVHVLHRDESAQDPWPEEDASGAGR